MYPLFGGGTLPSLLRTSTNNSFGFLDVGHKSRYHQMLRLTAIEYIKFNFSCGWLRSHKCPDWIRGPLRGGEG